VTVINGNGVSHILRIPKTARVQVGLYYRFYYQTEQFLGYEEIDATIAGDE
jgi:hypothetical protein